MFVVSDRSVRVAMPFVPFVASLFLVRPAPHHPPRVDVVLPPSSGSTGAKPLPRSARFCVKRARFTSFRVRFQSVVGSSAVCENKELSQWEDGAE